MLSNSEEVPIKRIKCRNFKINPILQHNYSTPLLLNDVWALKLTEKRNISNIVPLLPALPSSLLHLKRVHGGIVLLTDDNNRIEEIKTLISEFNEEITKVKVPAIKPITRAQFLESKQYWTSTFHEDKSLEKKLVGGLVYDPKTQNVIINETTSDPTRPLQHPVIRLVKALSDLQNGDFSEQYLATGYDVILSNEPCTMCAMALVHSRANRVFFGKCNLEAGALVTKWKLHTSPNLNHHYEVFQITEDSE